VSGDSGAIQNPSYLTEELAANGSGEHVPTLTADGDRSPETNNGGFQRRRQLPGVRWPGGALARCDLSQLSYLDEVHRAESTPATAGQSAAGPAHSKELTHL